MIDLLLSRFALQLRLLKELISDIPEGQMADQPATGMNHPAWVLGHLVWAADFVPVLNGGQSRLPAGWAGLHDARSRPSPDRSLYPSKQVLWDALEEGHTHASAASREFTPGRLAEAFPDPTFAFLMPTVGDAVAHILTTHEAFHSGQVSAWRRAAGLGPSKFMSFV